LSHPHIARLLDAGVTDTGQPYLVLEHVEGERIDNYCDARRLTPDVLLSSSASRLHIMGMPLRVPIRVPTYITDDLRKFPKDGVRYELLDGMLLVTPAPGTAHQVVLARLQYALSAYLVPAGIAYCTSPGEIEIKPNVLLDPDLLVFPRPRSLKTSWTRIRGWWLAAEVSGRSSRVYDRDFKRDAYLALGVREVWLVDLREQQVLVSRAGEPKDTPHRDDLYWHPPEMPAPLTIDLHAVFADFD
jgi:Uma2 family endonuclease